MDSLGWSEKFSLKKKVFEERPERSEAVSHVAIWRKRFPGIRKNK